MADNKEHHFCFAYKGDRMRETAFQQLHFHRVEGTTEDDGTQLVRISLQRKYGRRANTICKVLDAYNKISGTRPITPVPSGNKHPFICFKTNQPTTGNSILSRIDHDKRTAGHRFWRWDEKQTGQAPPKGMKRALLSGLENLVRELNLDPSTLCMQSAYDEITKAFFQVKGVELKNTGTFPAEDKEFILSELKRHFDRQRMYIVSPPVKKLDSNAAALTDPSRLMSDLPFNDAPEPEPNALNATVRTYLECMLPLWDTMDSVLVPANEILAAFNKDAVLYRRACVESFMRPLVDSGAATWVDPQTLRLDPRRAVEALKK